MAVETNGAKTTVSWNSVTLEVLGVTPPTYTRDDPVDNTSNSSGAIREFVAGLRYTIGELSVRAKFDSSTYATLKGLAGNTAGSVTTADLTVTYDSGATTVFDDCYCQSVDVDEIVEGSAPEMTVVFNQQTFA